MKIIVILTIVIIQFTMTQERFEDYLGKRIEDIKFEKSNYRVHYDDNKYSYFFVIPTPFYNNAIYASFLKFNEKKIITSVKINLISLVDKSTYAELVKLYGEPNHILVPDRLLYDSNMNYNSSLGQTTRKKVIKTREGTFEEKPIFIIWKKRNFEIQVLMKYSKNVSEISFTKLDNN